MTMRYSLLLGLSVLAGPVNLTAQNPAGDPARAQQLRRELEQRFAQRLKDELQLTADQDAKVRAIMGSNAEKRRAIEGREHALRQALGQQLRPGIAANGDSVGKLVDAIMAERIAYAQVVQGEMRELSPVLTPIQRGQLFLLRDRLFQRALEFRQQRMGAGRGGPPAE